VPKAVADLRLPGPLTRWVGPGASCCSWMHPVNLLGVMTGLRVFSSFEDAEDADMAFYASLTPRERLEILLDLIQRQQESRLEAPAGFERVYRVVELSEC
jgi:hypothetical protein